MKADKMIIIFLDGIRISDKKYWENDVHTIVYVCDSLDKAYRCNVAEIKKC